jgi:hypothetical protein
MRRSVRRSVVLAAVWATACGGGGGGNPAAPQRLPPQPVGLAAGATVTVVSGATGAPVAGVTLTIGGQTVATDAAGQARLPAAAPIGTMIDLTHASHLDRQTSVRSDTGLRFTLWPRTTAEGLNENYTATIAYTEASDEPPPVGSSPMYRLPQGTDTVVVVPSAELLADGAAMDAHTAAIQSATAANGGRVRFLLAQTSAPVGNSIVVTTRVDAADALCQERNLRGYMRGTYGTFVIVSGEIVFCDRQVARSPTVTHELGHAFGLEHAPAGSNDIMEPAFSSRRATSFGPRESLVMRMMLDRTPGNRFPDSDRTIAASALRERVTVCQ